MLEHVFFDLDHTLWDFERNSEECLKQIYSSHIPDHVPYALFVENFRVINKSLWRDLEFDRITHEELRRTRFQKTLKSVNLECSEQHALALNEDFMTLLPTQTHLMDGAVELLDYLKPKYKIHLISNGYLAIQTRKMTQSGILSYFSEIITSDVAESRKPQKQIFDYALNASRSTRANSVFIGDDEVADKMGSENAGMPFIHFDIHSTASTGTTVSNLLQLKTIL